MYEAYNEEDMSDVDIILATFEAEYGNKYNSQNKFDFSYEMSKDGRYTKDFIRSVLNSKSFKFKTQFELDKLTERQIEDYTSQIVQDNGGYFDKSNTSKLRMEQSDWKQYLAEIELYSAIRFKSTIYDRYDKWIKLADEGSEDHKTLANLLRKENGKDILYDISIKSMREKTGDIKYFNF